MGSMCCRDDDAHEDRRGPPPNHGGGQRLGGGGGGGGQQAFQGSGNTLGGGGVTSSSGIEATSAAAAAAMERANRATGAGASAKDRQLNERRQKDELIGKIEAHYSGMGKDPPFGLASSSLDALKKHLDHVKGQAAATAKADSRTAAAARVVRT
uniref:Uncharacterized protein n=1 Tax=Florenciella parvula TaxID=236787 RepID=A0A7S2FRJ2_9STRA